MDNVVGLVLASDAVRRQQAYEILTKLLDNADGNEALATFDDYSRLFDGICQWINSSSFKISLNGLDLVCKFAAKLGERMRQYVPQFASALFDRLGDNKEQVRIAAHDALANLMETVCAAQFLFDLVPNVFQSKQPRIREESLLCLRNALERYGGGGLSFQKLMPAITKLLDDPVPNVRDNAVQTLILAYRIYGEKFRQDLIRRNMVPANKLATLQQKFDEVKETCGANGENDMFAATDATDGTVSSVASSGMSQSVIVMKRTGSSSSLSTGGPGRLIAPKSQTQVTAKKVMTTSTMAQSQTRGREDGSVDEEIFRQAFEETSQLAQQVAHKFAFNSPREVGDFMTRVRDILPDTQVDWEKRVDALRDLRCFIILDGANNDDFWTGLRSCEFAFQSAVRDLRSQLLRETCITIAFLSNQLGETGRLEHFAEAVLPSLLTQIQNSARIMSSSAVTCVQFVVAGIQSPRLIPIIAGQLAASRSAVIRKHCCEFLELALHQWPTSGCLDRQTSILVESVKRGLSDADQEARASSRRAFWQLKTRFPTQAECMFNQLDAVKQKYILADQPLAPVRTESVIVQHIARPPAPNTAVPLRSRSASRGRGGLGSATSEDDVSVPSNGNGILSSNGRLGSSHPPSIAMPRRLVGGSASAMASPVCGAPAVPQQQLPPVPTVPSHVVSAPSPAMTSSVISTSATARVLPRSLPFNSPSRTTGASPQTPTTPTTATTESPGNRIGGRSRIPVSQSQPGSRSQSPSPRAQYITSNIPINNNTPGHLQANINIRVGGQDENRVRSASTISGQDDFTKQVSYRLGLAGLGYSSSGSRGVGGSCVAGGAGDDNNSDAGSMCSDRSFGGMSRLSDRSAPPAVGRQFVASSLTTGSGLSGRLFSVADVTAGRGVCYGPLNVASGIRRKDYGALVNRLGSSAWEDRRAGLTELQAQLITGQLVTLNQAEVDRLTSVFTKLFNDPNKKVFALFLDVLVDFVMRFYPQLSGWLFIMLTRLFTRYGAGDLLESVQNRVLRCIDVARQCFPADIQFSTVIRILLDQSQAQAIKAKVAILNYLQQLATYSMDPSHLVDNDEVRLVLFRLVTWTCDVRSNEVRRAAQGVIIAMFNLNSAEFSQILMKLQPKSQQMAMAILQSHMQNTSAQPPPPQQPSSQQPSTVNVAGSYLRRPSNSETPTDRPEDISRVRELIRETTSDILNLSRLTSMGDTVESGNSNNSTSNGRSQRPPIPPPSSSTHTTPQPPPQTSLPRPPYNPGIYQSSPTATANVPSTLPTQIISQLGALQSPMSTDPVRRLAGAVAILSSANGRVSSPRGTHHPPSLEEKQRALRDLAQLARQANSEAAWQAEFKNALFILSEILLAPMNNLDDVTLRSTALQTLERLALAMPSRFTEYVDFVVLRVLDVRGFQPLSNDQSGNTSNSEVANQQVRDVERCSMALASCLPAESLLRVLCPLIDRAEYPQNEQSIKMVTKAVERLDRASLGPLLGSICPGLVRACEHTQSSVRKAAVFCLVSLYLVVGEQLRQHLTALSQVKTKLLNLYIERTVSQMAQAQARRDSAPRTANGSSTSGHLPLSEANVS